SWFAGRSRLTLEGGTRIWGQWPTPADNYQVWELRLQPHETREATATAGEATQRELAQVASLAAPPPQAPAAGDVAIAADRAGGGVQPPKYEARVENDGCVTSLKIGGVELLESHASFSRGSYFFRQDKGRPLPMPTVEQPAGDVITAKGDLCSARYEFR